MKKVLFIRSSEYSIPPRIPKQAKTLASAGYLVKVLCWDRNKEYPKYDKLSYYDVVRYQMKAPTASNLLFLYMLFWWAYILYYTLKNKFNIIHACDLDTLPPVILTRFVKGCRIVYDIRDSYAEKILNLPNIVRNLIRIIDRILMNFVDAILICDTKRMGYLGNIPKVKPVEVIMNVPEFRNIESVPRRNSDLIINFCGFVHENRGIYQICDAVKDLDNITLEIIGPCHDETIIDYINQVKNARYYGQVKHDKSLKFMKTSDLVVALYAPTIMAHRYPNSNKVFEAMFCGKPILTNYGTSLADFVIENEIGYVVDYNDIAAMKAIITKILNQSSDSMKYGINGYRLFESQYNWEIMGLKLVRIYENL